MVVENVQILAKIHDDDDSFILLTETKFSHVGLEALTRFGTIRKIPFGWFLPPVT